MNERTTSVTWSLSDALAVTAGITVASLSVATTCVAGTITITASDQKIKIVSCATVNVMWAEIKARTPSI